MSRFKSFLRELLGPDGAPAPDTRLRGREGDEVRDTFEPAPARAPEVPVAKPLPARPNRRTPLVEAVDSFEPAPRAPVNLSGRTVRPLPAERTPPPPPQVAPSDFVASLDDLKDGADAPGPEAIGESAMPATSGGPAGEETRGAPSRDAWSTAAGSAGAAAQSTSDAAAASAPPTVPSSPDAQMDAAGSIGAVAQSTSDVAAASAAPSAPSSPDAQVNAAGSVGAAAPSTLDAAAASAAPSAPSSTDAPVDAAEGVAVGAVRPPDAELIAAGSVGAVAQITLDAVLSSAPPPVPSSPDAQMDSTGRVGAAATQAPPALPSPPGTQVTEAEGVAATAVSPPHAAASSDELSPTPEANAATTDRTARERLGVPSFLIAHAPADAHPGPVAASLPPTDFVADLSDLLIPAAGEDAERDPSAPAPFVADLSDLPALSGEPPAPADDDPAPRPASPSDPAPSS